MKVRLNQGYAYGAGNNVLDGWRKWHESLTEAGLTVNAIGNQNAGPLTEFESFVNTSVWRMSNRTDNFDPNTPNYMKNPEDEGYRMVSKKYEQYFPGNLDPEITWLVGCNEIRTKLGEGDSMWENLHPGEWWGRFGLAVSEYVLPRNLRYIFFNISSGDHDYEFWQQPSMIKLLATIVAFPENFMIGLHEYSYVSWNLFAMIGNDHATAVDVLNADRRDCKIGRFRILFDVCDSLKFGAWPHLYFTEFGWSLSDIPDVETAMQQLHDATQLIYGPYYKYIMGFGTWYLGIAEEFGGYELAKKTNDLMHATAQFAIAKEIDVIEEQPEQGQEIERNEGQAREHYNRKYIVADRSWLTDDELTQLYDLAKKSGMTIGLSFDDSGIGTNVSKTAYLYNCPENQKQTFIDWYAEWYPSTTIVFETIGDPPAETPRVVFSHWPTKINHKVTQLFGERPSYYDDFGLPGHEGVDLHAPTGTAVFAVASGVVSQSGYNSGSPNYGLHVRINHDDQFTTIYAHLNDSVVNVGQIVNGGDLIGHADNTGLSDGSHLHFGLKIPGDVYTDINGQPWPFNFFDPWIGLQPLHDAYLDNNGTKCWLWDDSLTWDQTLAYARTMGTLNARAEPLSSSLKLGDVETSELVRWEGEFQNGYALVTAVVSNTTQPPAGNARLGLHGPADDAMRQTQGFNEFKLLPSPKIIKVLSNLREQDVRKLAIENPNSDWVVRAFLNFGGRNISPVQFVNDTISDVKRTLNAIGQTNGFVVVELHNEPNLKQEGLFTTWANGVEFGAWLLNVYDLYTAQMPMFTLFMIPGLSPGTTVSGVKQNDQFFFNEMKQALGARFNEFDFVGIHAYWAFNYPMTQSIAHVDTTISKCAGLPVVITEASNNKQNTPTEMADQYVAFWREMKRRQQVKGVTYFCVSASNPNFSNEVWVKENNESRGIAALIANVLS